MKWVLIPIAIVALALIVSALIGSLLPKEHVASVRVRLKQPARTVWGTLTDFAAWPSWNTGVKHMERLADREGHPVWLLVDDNGRMPSEVVESTPPSSDRSGLLRTRIADPTLPFGGTWTWEITPRADECTVEITEDGVIHNPLFRFMARFVF